MPRKPDVLVTPVGVALYPWLSQAQTQFDKKGVYSVKLKLTEAVALQLVSKVDAAVAEQIAGEQSRHRHRHAAGLPYTKTLGGDYIFHFKLNACKKNGSRQAPKLFNVFGERLTRKPKIAEGSRLKVSFRMEPFSTPVAGVGISLRMRAVQIVTLVRPKKVKRDAAFFGFADSV